MEACKEVEGLQGTFSLEDKGGTYHAFVILTNVSSAPISILDHPEAKISLDAEPQPCMMSGPRPFAQWIELQPGETRRFRVDMTTVGVPVGNSGWKQLAVGDTIVRLENDKDYTINVTALPLESSTGGVVDGDPPANVWRGQSLPLPPYTRAKL